MTRERTRFGAWSATVVMLLGMVLLPAAVMANEVYFNRVLRPPEAFLVHGQVVGLSEEAHRALGINEGDFVEITTREGTSTVLPTKLHGNVPDAIYARKTIRDTLGIDSGNVIVRLRPYTTPAGQAATAGQTVTFNRIRRPPVEFLDYGDVIGISEAGLSRLGVNEGRAILVRSPLGKTLAARTKIHGSEPETLYMKKTLRDILEVEDGTILLTVAPVAWPQDGPIGDTIVFNKVGRPPEAFLDLGDTIGMAYEDMMRVKARPEDQAIVRSASGSLPVRIELLDREPGTIYMKASMRSQLSISDGAARVEVRVVRRPVRSAAASTSTGDETSVFWYDDFNTATSRARDEARPVMVFAHREGDAESRTVGNHLENPQIRRGLGKLCCYRLDASSESALMTRLGITSVPTLLFLTPAGEEIGRFEGLVSPTRINAGVDHSVRIVEQSAPSRPRSELE